MDVLTQEVHWVKQNNYNNKKTKNKFLKLEKVRILYNSKGATRVHESFPRKQETSVSAQAPIFIIFRTLGKWFSLGGVTGASSDKIKGCTCGGFDDGFRSILPFQMRALQAVQYFLENGASHTFGILPSNSFITKTASYQKLRNIEPQRLVAYKKQNKI